MSKIQRIRVEHLPISYARNYIALGADSAFFSVGASLISTTTVIPAFVDALGGSASLVGLISGLASGAWLLPQLLVASHIARFDRRKPAILRAAWLGRPLFFIFAILVMLLAENHANLLLGCLVAIICMFYVCDSFVSLPWMDLVSVAIPARRRGRLLGTSQALGGLGGIAIGALVNWLLGANSRWGFPTNYAIIFGLASVAFIFAATGLSAVKEPTGCYPKKQPLGFAQTLRNIPALLRDDRAFLRLIIAKITAGFVTMASSFYVLHAVQVGKMSVASTGLLISAQVAGTVASGLLMSFVQDAKGPLYHIRLTCVLAALPSAGALVLSLFPGVLGGSMAIYMAIFFVLGIVLNSLGWPFYNWILEYAPAERRPVYIGTINTLSALTMLAPLAGGLLVENVSYTFVFVVATAAAAIALVLSLGLPTTRDPKATENGVDTRVKASV